MLMAESNITVNPAPYKSRDNMAAPRAAAMAAVGAVSLPKVPATEPQSIAWEIGDRVPRPIIADFLEDVAVWGNMAGWSRYISEEVARALDEQLPNYRGVADTRARQAMVIATRTLKKMLAKVRMTPVDAAEWLRFLRHPSMDRGSYDPQHRVARETALAVLECFCIAAPIRTAADFEARNAVLKYRKKQGTAPHPIPNFPVSSVQVYFADWRRRPRSSHWWGIA